MRNKIRTMLALTAAAALALCNATLFAQFSSGVKEQRTTVTIKADGSGQVSSEILQSRASLEQQVRMWERYQKESDAEGDSSEETKPATKPVTETKPLTDAELTQKIRSMQSDEEERGGEAGEEKLNVEVQKDTVRLGTTRTFSSLEDMLRQGYRLWAESGLSFQNVRLEKDTNSQLRITFSPAGMPSRYTKMMRQQLKLSGARIDFRLVLPGKVLTSGLPESQTNATWISVDPQKDESLDALMKLYEAPVVVTAELGGLKVDQPLESRSLQRLTRRSGEAADDLPLTNAGPGFVAEPQSVTTTTLHLFPEGEKYFKENSFSYQQSTGTVVSAKLFAPKGRTLQSVSGVRVLKAADDKGRAIAPLSEDEETIGSTVYSGGSQDAGSMQIQLRLQLPLPDAQSIDEIAAEAVAVTVGTWKQMTLTNLQENATNEVDLAAVLPGAKLVITRFTAKGGQVSLQGKLTGPPTIRRLDLKARTPGSERMNSSLMERSYSAKAGQATRNFSIQSYEFREEGRVQGRSVELLVRYPEDLRRERVEFKLKGLDLL